MAALLPIPVVGAPELIALAETGDNPRGGSGGLLRAVGCVTKIEVRNYPQVGGDGWRRLPPGSCCLGEVTFHAPKMHGEPE